MGDKIQIFLPAFHEILHWNFVGLAKNLAYIVDFEENHAAFEMSVTSFTIDTRAGIVTPNPVSLFASAKLATVYLD